MTLQQTPDIRYSERNRLLTLGELENFQADIFSEIKNLVVKTNRPRRQAIALICRGPAAARHFQSLSPGTTRQTHYPFSLGRWQSLLFRG
jgi:hypothetical protein